MSDETPITLAELGGLAELGNIDLDGIKENRGGPLPKGGALWKINEMKLDPNTRTDKDTGEEEDVVNALMEIEIVELLYTKGVPNEEVEDVKAAAKGRKITQMFFLGANSEEIADGIGRIKAFATDAGIDTTGMNLETLFDAMTGHHFEGGISQKPSKDDKDVIFSRLDLQKIKPQS